MKLLFVGQGYPGGRHCDAGSGIGTYLRDLTLGLVARGHECHVLVWRKSLGEMPDGMVGLLRGQPLESECLDGVTLHALQHDYWPVLERILPDSRDVYNVRRAIRQLDQQIGFDGIEIESEEGIGIGVQQDFPEKSMLRVHTTLEQMAVHKEVPRSRIVRQRLAREARSLCMARHVWVSTSLHAKELRALFSFSGKLSMLPIGRDIDVERPAENAAGDKAHRHPTFLIVGSPDLRKGFDRIRAVLDAYRQVHGECKVVIVSRCPDSLKSGFGLMPPLPEGIHVEWLCDLSDSELQQAYRNADVLFHPARYESFGLPFIEAAAAGMPVVSTEVGAAPDLLGGNLRQFIVDGDDSAACANALHKAYENAFELGIQLRERYLNNYTRPKMVDRYLRLLNEALSKGL